MAKAVIGKRYRHYKGREYVVLALGRHSETQEELVTYQGQYNDPEFGNNPVWVRPRAMFEDVVVLNGETVQRFTMYKI